ncbi:MULTISPECIES: transaldolase family protein [unclassified Meiothermus]|uniref:transaldolase family protein n=1 Tax=unclassified Meiothermus TaxID=370471 RepID=UPI000D7C3E52|nr:MULTISPECIES: transaldolase family protein [unclassified Meiothermus]PZA08551.1 transaldolase [Meiothermus sp. Pnk-1]RYM40831.1 transaldolase [Meiothermus sp. PNK-Is4]
MKLYLDSADLERLSPLLETGVFYGVTTNPLLLREAGLGKRQLSAFAEGVLERGAREVYFQSWGGETQPLLEQGRELARLDPRVVVKLPATREGLTVASRLAAEGVRTCVTAVYAPFQALLAAAAGAAYVAPYLGRINDSGRDGHAVIAQMAHALRQTGSSTEILAASIRSTADLVSLAQAGVRCATVSPSIAERLFQEPLTLEATRSFENAASEVNR